MLPKVIIHALVSADGKMEGFAPEGIGLYYALAGRLEADTWLVGSDTLLEAERLSDSLIHPKDLAGDPLPEIAMGAGPLLVVPDSRGRVRNWFTHADGMGVRGTVALVSAATPRKHLAYLRRRNIPYVEAGEEHVDFRGALADLRSRYGSNRIQTDSGGVMNSVLLEQALVAEISLVISPELVGKAPRSLFRTLDIPSSLALEVLGCEQVGDSYVWLRYRLRS